MSYANPYAKIGTLWVLDDVRNERRNQNAMWGVQNHPDGTGGRNRMWAAEDAKYKCEIARAAGKMTYVHILAEEVCEAFAESDPVKLRAELVQVAAVAVQWIEKLDRADPFDGHDIDAGGSCRKPGCAWFSDHEDERVHTTENGDPL